MISQEFREIMVVVFDRFAIGESGQHRINLSFNLY